MSHISSVKYENGNLMNSESKLLCVGVYKDLSMTPSGSDIDQEFDASWESNCVYPSMFACPNLAAWDSQSNSAFGAAFITSPRASVACADDL